MVARLQIDEPKNTHRTLSPKGDGGLKVSDSNPALRLIRVKDRDAIKTAFKCVFGFLLPLEVILSRYLELSMRIKRDTVPIMPKVATMPLSTSF